MLFELDDDGNIAALADGSMLPDGAYTTLRTYGARRVLRLHQHVARLMESVTLQGTPATLDEQRVRRGLWAALARARFPEARVRVIFAPPRLFVALSPFEPLPTVLHAEGVTCATIPLRRDNPHAKDTRFLSAADAARANLPSGVHEGLMYDESDGAILEGLSSNFFGVIAGELRTEGERMLAGVTRAVVLELARTLAPVRLEPVRRHELPRLDEAFVTSASRGVLPVVVIDGQPIGDGQPGPLTRRLMECLTRLVYTEARDVAEDAR